MDWAARATEADIEEINTYLRGSMGWLEREDLGRLKLAKMISYRVCLWTDKMDEDCGYRRKHAWEHGIVYLQKNDDHGISGDKEMFRHIEDIPAAMKTLAKRNGIRVMRGRYSKGDKGKRLV